MAPQKACWKKLEIEQIVGRSKLKLLIQRMYSSSIYMKPTEWKNFVKSPVLLKYSAWNSCSFAVRSCISVGGGLLGSSIIYNDYKKTENIYLKLWGYEIEKMVFIRH